MKKIKYLVIYNHGIELGNIGIFEASCEGEAISIARDKFNTVSDKIFALNIEYLKSEWTYFLWTMKS